SILSYSPALFIGYTEIGQLALIRALVYGSRFSGNINDVTMFAPLLTGQALLAGVLAMRGPAASLEVRDCTFARNLLFSRCDDATTTVMAAAAIYAGRVSAFSCERCILTSNTVEAVKDLFRQV